MVKMPSKAQIETNYRGSIPVVSQRYKAGVESTTDWKEKAVNGQDLYVTKMQDGNVLDRRRKGLEKVSNEDWRKNAVLKGVNRIGPGMEAGASKQAAGYEPIRQALEGLTLPPRSANAMANIDGRVKAVVQTAIDAANK